MASPLDAVDARGLDDLRVSSEDRSPPLLYEDDNIHFNNNNQGSTLIVLYEATTNFSHSFTANLISHPNLFWQRINLIDIYCILVWNTKKLLECLFSLGATTRSWRFQRNRLAGLTGFRDFEHQRWRRAQFPSFLPGFKRATRPRRGPPQRQQTTPQSTTGYHGLLILR